jgi:alpha-glucoside transport system substrate-binding protein
MRKRWLSLFAVLLSFSLIAAACGDDDDDDGGDGGETAEETTGGGDASGVVTIFGPEVESEADSLATAFDPFTEETGIAIEYSGDRGFSELIGAQIEGGSPPDIGIFPQPGRVQDFGSSGDLVPVPEDTLATIEENFDPFWAELVTVDGTVYGVPNKGDLKSLVWYSPGAFEEGGYAIPESIGELTELEDQIIADGGTPWCIGIGSDAATGWPFTDWMEDWMLRMKGPEVYDQWVNHEIPFNDPQVVEVGQAVYDIWSKEGNTFPEANLAPSVLFAEAGLPLLDGDCYMHRQANFYAANWPEGTEVGPDGEVDAFYLPTIDDSFGTVVLGAGTHAVAFSDRPEVLQALAWFATAEYANERAPDGGFLSPNKNQDTALYATDIDRTFAEILVSADPFRFDASDLMPGAVGSDTFWTAAVDITTGAKTVQEAFDDVEASWPAE